MTSTALALQNVVVERQTSKGYTWVKCLECWTVEPSSARFFPERNTSYDTMPAAYFTALLAYDPDSGWHERKVKFVGADAENLFHLLHEKGQIALVSCEGHLMTKSFTANDDSARVVTTIVIKQGTVTVHAVTRQSAPPSSQTLEDYANSSLRDLEDELSPFKETVDTAIPPAPAAPSATDEPIWTSFAESSFDESEETAPDTQDEAPF